MERPGLDDNKRFEGGIFSGMGEEGDSRNQDRNGGWNQDRNEGWNQDRNGGWNQDGNGGWNQGGYNSGNPNGHNGRSGQKTHGYPQDFINPANSEKRQMESGQTDGMIPPASGIPNRHVNSYGNPYANQHGNAYANGYGNPYGHCPGRCGYGGCMNCHKEQKTDHTPVIIAVIISCIVLLLAFLATICCLLCVVSIKNRQTDPAAAGKNPSGYSEQNIPDQGNSGAAIPGNPQETAPEEGTASPNTVPFDEWSAKTPKTEPEEGEGVYGEIKDAIRSDLTYSVGWENYEYEGNSDTVLIAVDYPVLQGDIPNLDIINGVIAEETTYFEEYYKEYSKYMLPEEVFGVYSEGFVTYMDEEIMSVVFCETIYTDYWVDCGLFCVNIDVENGVILDNNSILNVDDAFAVEFRTRSKEQNGSISALDYMTDQEVAYYLTNAGTSIIFYTPLGMEVGLNYGEDYVTVTYEDYDKFIRKY